MKWSIYGVILFPFLGVACVNTLVQHQKGNPPANKVSSHISKQADVKLAAADTAGAGVLPVGSTHKMGGTQVAELEKAQKIIESATSDNASSPDIKAIEKPSCDNTPDKSKQLPKYLANEQIFVLDVIDHCEKDEKGQMIVIDSKWLGMGFPCSAGGGKVDITGKHYTNPNMIALLMTNSCPMKVPDSLALSRNLHDVIGIAEGSKLLAMYPFELQYWELVDYDDADIGDAVELRSTPALKKGWKALSENGVLRLRLYGRENGWISKHNLYYVDAEVKLVARRRFVLNIKTAKKLDATEINEVQKRCEIHRPSQDCDALFSQFVITKK